MSPQVGHLRVHSHPASGTSKWAEAVWSLGCGGLSTGPWGLRGDHVVANCVTWGEGSIQTSHWPSSVPSGRSSVVGMCDSPHVRPCWPPCPSDAPEGCWLWGTLRGHYHGDTQRCLCPCGGILGPIPGCWAAPAPWRWTYEHVNSRSLCMDTLQGFCFPFQVFQFLTEMYEFYK